MLNIIITEVSKEELIPILGNGLLQCHWKACMLEQSAPDALFSILPCMLQLSKIRQCQCT